jgi:nucleoside 2-deoxyribosyltransferase
MEYSKAKGMNFKEALADHGAQHVYNFDRTFLDRADIVVLVLPAGKSGHLELGYALGKGKKGYILLDGEPERYDVMYNFATEVFTNRDDLLRALP